MEAMNKLVRVVAVAALTLALALVGACPAAAQTDNRVTVAVLNFDMSNVRQWWSYTGTCLLTCQGWCQRPSSGRATSGCSRGRRYRASSGTGFRHSGRVDESQAVESVGSAPGYSSSER